MVRRSFFVIIWLAMLVGILHPFPMAGAQSGYYYPSADEWLAVEPELLGMNSAWLARIPDEADRRGLDYLNGLLVVKNGYIVYEHYFNGMTLDTSDNTRSVTKSITSALIGIAIERYDLQGWGQPISAVLPEYFEGGAYADSAGITLRDLLMMRSGLDWTEANANIRRLRSPGVDPVEAALNWGQASPPGTGWRYSTADSQLISAMFTRLTGRTLADYAAEHLFAPLGIQPGPWATDSQGNNIGGTLLALTTRDMARFGYLYLRGGRWQGAQIVPGTWVTLSTTPQNNGATPYCYHWWTLYPDRWGRGGFLAQGYGGEHILVIPAYDLVIVTRATGRVGNDDVRAREENILQFVREMVLAALTNR